MSMYIEDLEGPNIETFRRERVTRGAYQEEHHRAALDAAQAAYANGSEHLAEVWALRACHDGPSREALSLLGDACEQAGDLVNAERWYVLAQACDSSRTYERLTYDPAMRLRAIRRQLREQWDRRDLWQVLPKTRTPLQLCLTLVGALQVARETAHCALWAPHPSGVPATVLHVPVPHNLALLAWRPLGVQPPRSPIQTQTQTRDTLFAFRMPIRSPMFDADSLIMISPATARLVESAAPTTAMELAAALPREIQWGIGQALAI